MRLCLHLAGLSACTATTKHTHPHTECNKDESQFALALQDASPCNLAMEDIIRIRRLLTFWQVEEKLRFGFEYGYTIKQFSWASLVLANDSLIILTDSSLFLVSALWLFGVENEHIILLSFASETGEQFEHASRYNNKHTTVVFMQVLESAWFTRLQHSH